MKQTKIMTYAEKLKDPRWQRKRLEIMQRDEFICTACKASDKSLNVHHCYYLPRTNVWEYPDSAMVSLCEDCHNEITFRIPKVMEKIKTPDDATRWESLMTLIGSSSSQSYTMALKIAFAMDSLNSAVTQHDRIAAVKIFQILRSEIDKITTAILKDEP